jgi:hypothetical protein
MLAYGCIWISVSIYAQTARIYDPVDDLAPANLKDLRGLGVVVSELDADLSTAGITETLLKADAEQKLKRVGLKILNGRERLNSPGKPYVYLFVSTQCDSQTNLCGVDMEVKLMERVSLQRNPNVVTYASSWLRGELAILPRERLNEVRSLVGTYLTQFTEAYTVSNH